MPARFQWVRTYEATVNEMTDPNTGIKSVVITKENGDKMYAKEVEYFKKRRRLP